MSRSASAVPVSEVVRWCIVGFFTLFAIGLVSRRNQFAELAGIVREPRDEDQAASRLRAAIVRREALEALPSAAMACWLAGVLLIAAMLGAFTQASPALLYALGCVALAAVTIIGYSRLRSPKSRRIASLRARDLSAAIPMWVGASIVVVSLTPLAFVDLLPVEAVLVTLASLAIVAAGVRVTRLPALLSGEDPRVEEYLDRRIRAIRALSIVLTAGAPGYLFDTVAVSLSGRFSGVHMAAWLIAIAATVPSTFWFNAVLRRQPDAPELERWTQAGG